MINISALRAGMSSLERKTHSVTPRIEKFGTPIVTKSVGCSTNIGIGEVKNTG